MQGAGDDLRVWLHRAVLHAYPAVYLWAALGAHHGALSVYFCGLALLVVHRLADPFRQDSAALELSLATAVLAAAPLALELLVAALCLCGLGPRAAAAATEGGPCKPRALLPALACGAAVAHCWYTRTAPGLTWLPAPGGSAAGGRPAAGTAAAATQQHGRALRLCGVLALGAALDYNVFGVIYFAVCIATMLSEATSSLHQVVSHTGLTWCRQALMLLASLHLCTACASLWLQQDGASQSNGWWRVLLAHPDDSFRIAQCFCSLILIGELNWDIMEEAEANNAEAPSRPWEIELPHVDATSRGSGARPAAPPPEPEGHCRDARAEVMAPLLAPLLLELSLCLWSLVWPVIPSVPMLVTGVAMLWRPLHPLPRSVLLAVPCYAAVLCFLCYLFAVYCKMRGELHRWATLVGFDSSIMASVIAEDSPHLARAATLGSLTLLAALLAHCTRWSGRLAQEPAPARAVAEAESTDANCQWWAVRILLALRGLTVALVLSVGLEREGPDGKSSLFKLGYVCWFIGLLHDGETGAAESSGWDVLRGRRAHWGALLAYGGAVSVALFLWRALALPDFSTMGFVRSDLRFTRLSPHIAIAMLASVQRCALEQSPLQGAFFVQISVPAHLLLRLGVFAQLSLLLLAVLLPPVSIDSFVLLVLFVAIMLVAQISMRTNLLLALLELIASIAWILLLLRCVVMLPIVQEGLTAVLDPEHYPTLWKSLALHTALVSPWQQYLMATLLLLSRALCSAIRLALILLDEEVQTVPLSSTAARTLEIAKRWFPWGLMAFAYVLTISCGLHCLSSLRILVVLLLLFTGRGWCYVGTLVSACASVSLLAQYLACFDFAQLDPKRAEAWGVVWTKVQVCQELLLVFLSILQRAVHYRAGTEAEAALRAAASAAAGGPQAGAEGGSPSGLSAALAGEGRERASVAVRATAAEGQPGEPLLPRVEAEEEGAHAGMPELRPASLIMRPPEQEEEEAGAARAPATGEGPASMLLEPARDAEARASQAPAGGGLPGKPSVLATGMEEMEEHRLHAYDVQLAAFVLLFLTVLRSSVWSIVFAVVLGAFFGGTDAPRELDLVLARSWLQTVASALLTALLWQHVVNVWMPLTPGIEEDAGLWAVLCSGFEEANITRLVDGTSCSPVAIEDLPGRDGCMTQRQRCAADWASWLQLSGGLGLLEFAVFLMLCSLRWAGQLRIPGTSAEAKAGAAVDSAAAGDAPAAWRLGPAGEGRASGADPREGHGPTPGAEGALLLESDLQAPMLPDGALSSEAAAAPARDPALGTDDPAGAPVYESSSSLVITLEQEPVGVIREQSTADEEKERQRKLKVACIYGSIVATWLAMLGAFLMQPESNAIALGFLCLAFMNVSTIYNACLQADPVEPWVKMSRAISLFNFVVVVAFSVFQCPAVPCPYTMSFSQAGGRTAHLSSEQCQGVVDHHGKRFNKLGMLFACLGLMKTFSPLSNGAFGAWNLLICGSCTVQRALIVRFHPQLLLHLTRQRRHLEHRAKWYVNQHKILRSFQLSTWDTKRKVLLTKLHRLTAHLDAIREIWDGQRSAFTEDEERENQWDTRVENLCLRSGVRRAKVELLLREFNEAALASHRTMDAQTQRLMHIQVDKYLLEYLHQHRLRMLRMITKEEEESARAMLKDECSSLDLGLDARSSLRSSTLAGSATLACRDAAQKQGPVQLAGAAPEPAGSGGGSNSPAARAGGGGEAGGDGPAQRQQQPLAPGATGQPKQGKLLERLQRRRSSCVSHSESEDDSGTDDTERRASVTSLLSFGSSNLVVGFLRKVCYDAIDDFLFISSRDMTQFEHRRKNSLLGLIFKVVCSQMTPLLVAATALQFMEYRSVTAALSVAGVALALSVYPHVPWRIWNMLYYLNSAVVFAKMLFQLQIFCPDGSLTFSLEHQECPKPNPKSVPWTAVAGLVKAVGDGADCGSGRQTLGSVLWADLLVCLMVLLNMFAALHSGRCNLKKHIGAEHQDHESAEAAPVPLGGSFGESALSQQSAEPTAAGGNQAAARPSQSQTGLERIMRIHFWIWRLTSNLVSQGKDMSFEHFVSTSTTRRPSRDLYAFRFTIILVLLGLLIFMWPDMTGEGKSLDEALSSNQFSGTQVIVLILFMLLIVSDRILYTWYRSDLFDEAQEVPADEPPSPARASLSTGQGAERARLPEEGLSEAGHLRIFVRLMHKALLVTHIVIIHTVFMIHWSTATHVCLDISLLSMQKSKLVCSCFYVLYLLYIVLSSLQLRYDVHVVQGGLRFTKSTDLLTKTAFRVYSALPFLHELRVLTDWTASVTSLDYFMWMKLEDAQHNLYRVRTDMELRAAIPPGEKRPLYEKVTMGGVLLFLLLFLLIGPILYFSSLNSLVLKANPVVFGELTVSLEIASQGASSNSWSRSLNLFKAQAQNIERSHRGKVSETVQTVTFPRSSDSFWMISPSARDSVARLLREGGVKASIVLSYVFDREATAVKATGRDVSERLDNETIKYFAEVFNETATTGGAVNRSVVWVRSTFYPHKRLSSSAKIRNLTGSRPVQLELFDTEQGSLPHWDLTTGSADQCSHAACDSSLVCTLTSDDVASAGASVHSLYVGVVLTIGNFLRLIFKDSSKRVIYEEVPDQDLLLDLCDGIYIARIQGDLDAEYRLYYELIRIYRSPEMIARVSQPKALTQHRQPRATLARVASQAEGLGLRPRRRFLTADGDGSGGGGARRRSHSQS